MQFHNSTPQTVAAYIAKRKSGKASQRKSAHASDVEPSTKEKKVPDASLSADLSLPGNHAMIFTSPTEEPMKLVDASLPLAETQARNTTGRGPATEKQNSDQGSIDSSRAHDTESYRLTAQEPGLDQGPLSSTFAQVDNVTDHESAAKKQKLSSAKLLPARVRQTLSNEDVVRIDDYHWRRRLESWCRRFGFDDRIISKMSDELLRSPTSDIYHFILEQSSRAQSDLYGALQLDIYRSGAHNSFCDRTSIPSSSLNSPYNSSDPIMGYSMTSANSDKLVSLRSDCEKVDDTTESAGPNHLLPLSRGLFLGDDTSVANTSQIPAVEPVRNKGGRPKGRKPRALKPPKTPKGPTRFQKNHPVKAAVNVDVWGNILLFCPPEFLLKARTISSTFRSLLKDDSVIWKISRINHFGSDMPEPPLGLSEPQYADLLTGTGCQTRGCEFQKTRKTYWAFQKRLCVECFQKSMAPKVNSSNLIPECC